MRETKRERERGRGRERERERERGVSPRTTYVNETKNELLLWRCL